MIDKQYLEKKDYSWCQQCHLKNIGETLFSGISSVSLKNIKHKQGLLSINTDIYSKDEEGRHIYTLKQGIVKIGTLDENGNYKISSLITKGMSFGLEVINQSSYLHNAQSLTPVEICQIKLSSKQINTDKKLLNNLLVKWQEHLMNQTMIFEQFTTGDTKGKILRLFAFLGKNTFLNEKNKFYIPTLEDISSIVNVSKENCSRAIAKLKTSKQIYLIDATNKIYCIN